MKQICILFLIISLVQQARAFDVGLPGAGETPAGPYALELVVEQFDREIHQEIRGFDGTFFGDQTEDRIYAHFGYRFNSAWSLQLKTGMSDSTSSEDPALLLGATTMWSNPFAHGARAHVYIGAQWVDGITYKTPASSVGGVRLAAESRKEEHLEGTIGFLVSKDFTLNPTWGLTPYLGMQLSVFRGKGEESFFLSSAPDVATQRESGLDFEEDGQLGSTLGLRVDAPADWYFRIEGRIIDQQSVSAGFGRDF
jgi:hypothetical protein